MLSRVPVSVRELRQEDVAECERILRSLPDFFGHEGGLADAFAALRSQRGLVAAEGEAVLGFCTWERRTAHCAEITWMAVRRERHHGGIGTAIVETTVGEMGLQGFRLALAITSGAAKDGPDTYEPTRRFWTARGFLPLIELDIWDTNLALLQVRAL